MSTKKRATYDDLKALPDHVVGQIIDGELVVSPRPASPHALASSAIGGALFDPFNRSRGGDPPGGGWWIVDEPELHFGEDVLVPDLAGWRRERMPKLPNTPAFELPPDWVCEVVSPSTAKWDRTRKMDIYATVGIRHHWLVEPLEKLLEIYRLEGSHWLRCVAFTGNQRVRAEPFEAIEIDLSRWWIDD